MNGYMIFWAILIIFCLISFTLMTVRILIYGAPELKEMFDLIKKNISAGKASDGNRKTHR